MNEHDDNLVFARPSSEARDANGNTFWPPAQNGLSLRDYFAAAAIAAIISLASDADAAGCAHDAYLYADAMLAQRKAKQ